MSLETLMSRVSLKDEIRPVILDCNDLRKDRQNYNNKLVYGFIKAKDKESLYNKKKKPKKKNGKKDDTKDCNTAELSRTLSDLNITFNQLMTECENNDLFAKLLARNISVNSSRQGTKDEAFVLQACGECVKQVGVYIENLTTSEYRPTKDGRILTDKEYKEYKNSGVPECLKSFDAKISGKCKGWIFAKVCYGKGGHQDNVFIEASYFGEWVEKYGEKDELFVILIDTNNNEFSKLKDRFHKDNLIVVNHVELQQYIIDKYN